MKSVHLRPRLQAVADRVHGARCAADIGCDHGRLCVALLQSGRAEQVIGTDISAASLAKAHALRTRCALDARLTLREADGLSALTPNEADTLIFCGMGGETIARLLSAHPAVAASARELHMQPMRGEAELRAYLYGHGFSIFEESLVLDAGRYYQIISARPGTPSPPPPESPAGMYAFGPLLFEKGDPLLLPMLRQYRAGYARRLALAQKRGQTPKALCKLLADTDALIVFAEEKEHEA